jgi:hypothetical protein
MEAMVLGPMQLADDSEFRSHLRKFLMYATAASWFSRLSYLSLFAGLVWAGRWARDAAIPEAQRRRFVSLIRVSTALILSVVLLIVSPLIQSEVFAQIGEGTVVLEPLASASFLPDASTLAPPEFAFASLAGGLVLFTMAAEIWALLLVSEWRMCTASRLKGFAPLPRALAVVLCSRAVSGMCGLVGGLAWGHSVPIEASFGSLYGALWVFFLAMGMPIWYAWTLPTYYAALFSAKEGLTSPWSLGLVGIVLVSLITISVYARVLRSVARDPSEWPTDRETDPDSSTRTGRRE